MVSLLLAQLFIPPPGPLPRGLHTRVHVEAVASPFVSVRGGGEDGVYPDSSDSDEIAWLAGGRALFGIDFSPRFELGMGAGYYGTHWSRTVHTIAFEARLSWYPIDLEYRGPTLERPRSKAGAYFGFGPTVNWEPQVGDGSDSTLLGVGADAHAAPVVSWQLDRTLTTLSFALEASLGMRRFSNGDSYLREGYVIRSSVSLIVGGSLAL